MALDVFESISNVPRFLPFLPIRQSLEQEQRFLLRYVEIKRQVYNKKLANRDAYEVFDSDGSITKVIYPYVLSSKLLLYFRI